MAEARKPGFAPFAAPAKGVLVVFCDEGMKYGPATRRALAPTGDLVRRAAAADNFTGKSGSSLDIVAPAGLRVARLTIVGAGKTAKLKAQDLVKLGGIAMGKGPARAEEAGSFAELCGGAAQPARGARVRRCGFGRNRPKRKEGEDPPAKVRVSIAVANPAAASKAWSGTQEPV